MELFSISFILVLSAILYYYIAKRLNILDNPNNRSSHVTPTVRGGGIIFLVALILFWINSNFQYSYFIVGVAIIGIVSFIDDLFSLSSKIRLFFQIISISLLLISVGYSFSPIWIFLALIFLGIFVVNIYNFMDGINGITGLYSISVFTGLYMINMKEQIVNKDLIIYSLLALIIFGFYNFRKKALFFAGDVGSITMGMITFFVTLFIVKELESPVVILLLVVYGCDSLLTLGYRQYKGENLTKPHRLHIYQKLTDVEKVPHLAISFSYMVIQLIVNVLVYNTYSYSYINQIYIFVGVCILFIFVYFFMFRKLEKKHLKSENL